MRNALYDMRQSELYRARLIVENQDRFGAESVIWALRRLADDMAEAQRTRAKEHAA